MIYSGADWDKIWRKGFKLSPLQDWAADIFVTAYRLLKNSDSPKVLSAGCGRGLIDYWLIHVFGYNVVLLDHSTECIRQLKRLFCRVPRHLYAIAHASIFSIPYPDCTFDLVWNEGVLEHFSDDDMLLAIKEMSRVSRKYILIDVPYAGSKPYCLSKRFLEENKLWSWGHESPKLSLREELNICKVEFVEELLIGSEETNRNYVAMVPAMHRQQILDQLVPQDFQIFPHLLTIGKKIHD